MRKVSEERNKYRRVLILDTVYTRCNRNLHPLAHIHPIFGGKTQFPRNKNSRPGTGTAGQTGDPKHVMAKLRCQLVEG
jgi:hypothetical protein